MKLSKAIFGEKLFGMIMKSTFYGHFVAGEDRYKIVPTLERLKKTLFSIFFLLLIRIVIFSLFIPLCDQNKIFPVFLFL